MHEPVAPTSQTVITGPVVILCPREAAGDELRELPVDSVRAAPRLTVVRDAVAALLEIHRGAQRLVVVRSPHTRRVHELIAVVSRYYPWVVCVDAAGLPMIGGSVSPGVIESQIGGAAGASVPAPLADGRVAWPVDRAHSPEGRRAEGGAGAATLIAAHDLISDEELAMLMGPLREG